MEDIVNRLRVLNFMGPWQEAADEIERLREALRKIADREGTLDNECADIVARFALTKNGDGD